MGAVFFASLLFHISLENLHMTHECRKTDLVKPAVIRFGNRSIGLHHTWTQMLDGSNCPRRKIGHFLSCMIFFFSQMKMQRVHPRTVLPPTALLIEPCLKNNNLWCPCYKGLTFARWSENVKMFICMWLADVSHCKKLVSEGNRNHSFNMLCCVLCTTKSVCRIPSNDVPYFFWNYITWSLTQASIYHAIVVTAT